MPEAQGSADPEPAEATLAALGGKYAARILAAADEPMSAHELSDALSVPIATCYRRIEELEEAELLVCAGQETSDRGRQRKVYRRVVDGAVLDVAGSDPRLDVQPRADASDDPR